MAKRAKDALLMANISKDVAETKKCKCGCDRLDESLVLKYRRTYYNQDVRQDFERRQKMLDTVRQTIRDYSTTGKKHYHDIEGRKICKYVI